MRGVTWQDLIDEDHDFEESEVVVFAKPNATFIVYGKLTIGDADHNSDDDDL